MKLRRIGKWCGIAAFVAVGTNLGLHAAFAAPAAPAPADTGAQVLTRGPVHEAFAETVTYNPEAGIIAPKAPPAAIEELPPDQRPQGANVAWIPGYWAWDDERKDFLWVSGIWRDLPPGRQWVPGYWSQSANGSQWTSGYWADSQVNNVQYLPEPPASVEAGPNIAAPSADDTWLPGSWMWQQNRYAWRPGFWAGGQPNWDWVPAHYVWAPRGYVFVDGYWDYSLGRRGVLFAPVYFNGGAYSQPGFSYSPSMVIDLGALANCLFLRPNYQHYYFGDYYAANYQSAGFYPSYSYNSGQFGYDPIFAHERWQHRGDGQWEQGVAADFLNRRENVNARPPHTWAAQSVLGGARAGSGARNAGLAIPYSEFTKSQTSPMRFQPVDPLERQKLVQSGQSVQRYRDERQKLETTVTSPATGQAANPHAASVTRHTSPIMARPISELDKAHVPPQMHEQPKTDPRVEARPRATASPEQPQQHTLNRLPLDTPKVQPQPQPKAVQPTPQPQQQPKVERPAPEPSAVHPAAGPIPEKGKEK